MVWLVLVLAVAVVGLLFYAKFLLKKNLLLENAVTLLEVFKKDREEYVQALEEHLVDQEVYIRSREDEIDHDADAGDAVDRLRKRFAGSN